MKQICMMTILISSAVIISSAQCVYAENTLTGSEPSESYGTEAKRIEYIGEKTAFSVDIPSDYFDKIELSDGSIRTMEDGSSEWDLFFGENEEGYISCVFHQGEKGYEGEIAEWTDVEGTALYTGTDADGQPYNIAELELYGFNAFIGEFPMEDDTWLNITLSLPEARMDIVREDIITMMGTFTRNCDNADDKKPATDDAAMVNYEGSPDTGTAFPPIILPALAAAAILIAINKNI